MRGKLFAALLLFVLLSCGKPSKRIDIKLVNSTGRTITIHAQGGIFGRTIKLWPGSTWEGWVPAGFKVSGIKIEMK